MSAAVPAIVAGTALYSAFQSNKATQAGQQATEDAKNRADQQQAQLLSQQMQQRQQQGALSYVLRRKLLTSAQGGGDQGGTLLSGPLGVSAPPAQSKSLLGN